MKDAVTPQEARDIVAKRMVENAQKNGQKASFEQAQQRVGSAMSRGDQKRDNGNR